MIEASPMAIVSSFGSGMEGESNTYKFSIPGGKES